MSTPPSNTSASNTSASNTSASAASTSRARPAPSEAADALFPALLGADFDRLPGPVRRLHLRAGAACYAGEVQVDRGPHPLARLCAWATRLPPASAGPLQVEIVAADGREAWTRHIGGRAMPSRLWAGRGAMAGLLCERLGLVVFGFALTVEPGAHGAQIVWRVRRLRVFGLLPLPARWFDGVEARESVDGEGRYHFDVRAALPLAGRLVHYRGWLEVP